jgi:hypothetical protein
MKLRYICLISLMLQLVAAGCFSADSANDTPSIVKELMVQIRNGFCDDIRERALYTRDPAGVLAALVPYQSDVSSRAREHAFTLGWIIAVQNPKSEIRTEVVERLVTACGDSDALVWQSASGHLLSFPPQYFSDKAKQSIRGLLSRSDRLCYVLLIAGQANMTGDIPTIRTAIAKTSDSEYGQWVLRLPLARMGSKADIAYCIQRVLSEPNDIRRVGRMLQGLAYMRQPAAVVVLRDILESDECLPSAKDYATRTKPDVPHPGLGFAQYAIDILANTLEGFPVPARYPGGYSIESIEQARNWMRAQVTFTFTKEPTIYRPDLL